MPEYRLRIIVEGEDRASGPLNQASGSLSRIGEFAAGGLIVGGIQAIGSALGGMAGQALESYAGFERLGMSLEAMVAKEIRNASGVEQVNVVGQRRIQLSAQEQASLAKLQGQYDSLSATLAVQKEHYAEAAAAGKDSTAEMNKRAVTIAQNEQKLAAMGGQIGALSGKEGQLVNVTEKVITGQLSMSDAMGQAGPRAKELLDWITKLAIKSPFKQEDVAQAFKMGMTYGFTSEQAQRYTQAMIDMVSATGGTGEVMGKVSLALGQIQARGKVSAQELNQLSEAGVNARQILADAFGKSTGEIEKMIERGLIPADKAIEAIIKSMETDYGGAAARQASSFSGLISSISDIKEIGLREFFTGTFQAIQPYLDRFVSAMSDPKTMETIRGWGNALGTWIADGLAKGAQFLKGLNAIGTAVKSITDAFKGGNYTDLIEKLQWYNFIPTLSWSDWTGKLTWGSFVVGIDLSTLTVGLTWGDFMTVLSWDNKVFALKWGDFVSILDWKNNVLAIEWGDWLIKLTWTDFVTKLEWGNLVAEIDWDAKVGGLIWGDFVGIVDWDGKIIGLRWDDFVAKITWDDYILNIVWGDFVATLAWGDYAAFLQWGDFIAQLSWSSSMTQLIWGDFIGRISWDSFGLNIVWGDFVAFLTWGDVIESLVWTAAWIPAILWSDFIDSLHWTADFITSVDWNAFVSDVSLATYVSSLTWADFVKAVNWVEWITKLAWTDFVDHVTWLNLGKPEWDVKVPRLNWVDHVFSLSWGDFILFKLDWSQFIPRMTSYAEYLSKIDWAQFINPLAWPPVVGAFVWGNWITNLAWPNLSFNWSDFINPLAWPPVVGAFVWGDWITNLTWPDLKLNWGDFIPDFPGWQALWDAVSGAVGGGGGSSAPAADGTTPPASNLDQDINASSAGLSGLIGPYLDPLLSLLPAGASAMQPVYVTVNVYGANTAQDWDAAGRRVARSIQRNLRGG